MKIVNLILTLCLVCGLTMNAQNKKKGNTEEVTFEVSMTCNNCKKRIEKTIPWEKGVKDMNVDLPTKTVTVKYDTRKTSVEALKKAIEDLDFASVRIKTDDKKLE